MPRGDDLDALIARAQDGDVRAFEDLLEGHLAQVRRFARAFASGPADADDLAQEALIKVHKSLRLFRYQSAFSSWLYAVVRNVFLDSVKGRRGREKALEEPLSPTSALQMEGGELPDAELHREQEKQRLWRALREVPAEFRSALVLFDLEGCSYDEVAAIEGVPVGTVKSRLSRGRAALRKALGEPSAGEPGTARDGASGTQPATSSSNRPRSGS